MPVINGIGMSAYTEFKQRNLGQMLKTHLICVNAIHKKWGTKTNPVYNYYDTHAGPGFYEDIQGSPLIFAKTISHLGYIPHRSHFFEVSPEHRYELNKRLLSTEINYKIYPEFQTYFNSSLTDLYPQRMNFGLIYADPNGIKQMRGGDSEPESPLWFFEKLFRKEIMKRIDILFYIAAGTYKRILGCGKTKPVVNIPLNESLSRINKKYWLVREPLGADQWSFFLGTNWADFPILKGIGMHSIDSSEGRLIWNRLTKKIERQQLKKSNARLFLENLRRTE